MDDLMMIRFALDNARPPELAKQGHLALDRLIDTMPTADRESGEQAKHVGQTRNGTARRPAGRELGSTTPC